MEQPGYKSIDTSVDSWLTLDQHLSQTSVESWLTDFKVWKYWVDFSPSLWLFQ